MTSTRRAAIALYLSTVASAFIASPAPAGVIDASSNGFTIQILQHIDAPPAKVYAALISPAKWWSSDHTFSGSAANLHLDARAGGCWCETLAGGGSVSHLTVVYVDPGKALRLRGALGPFQAFGVDGAMTWALKPGHGGTDLSLTYALGGYSKEGFDKLSKGADGVLTEQVSRLKRLAEEGAAGKH